MTDNVYIPVTVVSKEYHTATCRISSRDKVAKSKQKTYERRPVVTCRLRARNYSSKKVSCPQGHTDDIVKPYGMALKEGVEQGERWGG